MKEAFNFIFSGGVEYMLDWKERNKGAFGSIMLNLSQWGIRGYDKGDKDVGEILSHLLSKYHDQSAIYSYGGKFTYIMLNDKQRSAYEDGNAIMKAKGTWFFPILQIVWPRLLFIETKQQLGCEISTYLRKVSEVDDKLRWYKQDSWNKDNVRQDSIFIRVKITSSRYGLFEVYRDQWNKFIKICTDLKIEYKVVE